MALTVLIGIVSMGLAMIAVVAWIDNNPKLKNKIRLSIVHWLGIETFTHASLMDYYKDHDTRIGILERAKTTPVKPPLKKARAATKKKSS